MRDIKGSTQGIQNPNNRPFRKTRARTWGEGMTEKENSFIQQMFIEMSACMG